MNTNLEDLMRNRLGEAAELFDPSDALESTTVRRVRNRRRRDITITSAASLMLVVGIGGAAVALRGGDSNSTGRLATEPTAAGETTTTVADASTATAPVPDTTAPPTPTTTIAPIPTPAPVAPVVVAVQRNDQGRTPDATITGSTPRLDETDPTVAEKVNQKFEQAYDDFKAFATGPTTVRYNVTARTPDILSVQMLSDFGAGPGNARGEEHARGFIFDLRTGDELSVPNGDVFSTDRNPAAGDYVANRLADLYAFPWALGDNLSVTYNAAQWTVAKDGLHATWNAGTVAPYGAVDGFKALEVVVPWSVVDGALTGRVDPNTL